MPVFSLSFRLFSTLLLTAMLALTGAAGGLVYYALAFWLVNTSIGTPSSFTSRTTACRGDRR